jgi:hypothetical protein
MKLSHFVVLAVVALGLAIFGLSRACKSGGEDVPPPPSATPPQVATPTGPDVAPPPSDPGPDSAAAPATASDLAARSYDAEVIAWSKRSISGDKMKDATKGKSWKLNLYKDAGYSTVNRAKVDTNRNDKFDEKYTFETTKITLQRAPNDDENYTETFHWNGSGWTKE